MVQNSESALLDTVGLIYAAAAGASPWPEALNAVSDLCGMANTALVVNDRSLRLAEVVTPRADPQVIRAYEDHWWREDPTIPATATAPVGTVTSLETTGRDLFLKSRFHNEFWVASGLGVDRLASNLVLAEHAFASLVLQNGPTQDGITSRAAAGFRLILPHMMRAVQIMRRAEDLSLSRIASSHAVARGAACAFPVDSSGRPLGGEDVLDQMLRRYPALRLDAGRLVVARSAPAAKLARLIASCSGLTLARRGGTLHIDEGTSDVLTLEVLPWPGPDAACVGPPRLMQPVALILVRDPTDDLERRRDGLQQRYGLTPAESRVAVELLKGGGRSAAAERLGISDATARTHLTRIFEKTDTRRQSELVTLILRDR